MVIDEMDTYLAKIQFAKTEDGALLADESKHNSLLLESMREEEETFLKKKQKNTEASVILL